MRQVLGIDRVEGEDASGFVVFEDGSVVFPPVEVSLFVLGVSVFSPGFSVFVSGSSGVGGGVTLTLFTVRTMLTPFNTFVPSVRLCFRTIPFA